MSLTNDYFFSTHIHSAKIMTKIRKIIIKVIIISVMQTPPHGGVETDKRSTPFPALIISYMANFVEYCALLVIKQQIF